MGGLITGMIIGAIFSSSLIGIGQMVLDELKNPENYRQAIDKVVEHAPQIMEGLQ